MIMWQIINARPQRLEMNPLQYCHLWDYKGNGCKFCSIAGTAATVEKPQLLDLEEIDETLSVALREKGRFGYSSEEEAINQTLSEAEEIMKHGVDVVSGVWRISDHSIFRGQKQASANYYLSIAEGLLDLRIRYGVLSDIDTYRRCGNHPDTDLQRECFVEGR